MNKKRLQLPLQIMAHNHSNPKLLIQSQWRRRPIDILAERTKHSTYQDGPCILNQENGGPADLRAKVFEINDDKIFLLRRLLGKILAQGLSPISQHGAFAGLYCDKSAPRRVDLLLFADFTSRAKLLSQLLDCGRQRQVFDLE